jgi:hypothetical protein
LPLLHTLPQFIADDPKLRMRDEPTWSAPLYRR